MIVHRMEQRSEAWFAARCGIPTASQADKIVTPTGKLSAQSDALVNALLAERAGFVDEPFEVSEWMQRGIDLEPEARAFFELDTGLSVETIGFVTNDDGTAGCSPDGLITHPKTGEVYGFEIKCPKASTQIGYLRGNDLPAYYRPQVHMSMAVTGLDRWFFVSYYPGLNPLIVLVERDEYTEAVGKALREFVERLDEAARELELELARASA